MKRPGLIRGFLADLIGGAALGLAFAGLAFILGALPL